MAAPLRQDKYDGKAAQVGHTRRWIENSGPEYVEMDFEVVSVDTMQNIAAVIAEGDKLTYPARAFSYASWYMLCGSRPGDKLDLKIRCDESFYNRVDMP